MLGGNGRWSAGFCPELGLSSGSIPGAGTEQVEPEALVVDAFGIAAGLVLRDGQYLPTELAHAIGGGFDVVDPEVDAHLRCSLTSVDSRRWRDGRDVERPRLVTTRRLPAEQLRVEAPGAVAVGDLEGDIAD